MYIPCEVFIEAVSIFYCNILINQFMDFMTVLEHLSWEEHIRNSHLLILRDAVHNSPQSKEKAAAWEPP